MRLNAIAATGILALALVAGLLVSTLPGNAVPVDEIDQEWDGQPPPHSSGGNQIHFYEPIGMSFAPSQSRLAAVDAFLSASSDGDAMITARIRRETIDREIVGSVARPVSAEFTTWVRFLFAKPLSLEPGQTYVMELESDNEKHLWENTSGSDGYPYGNAILSGQPFDADFLFRTYSAAGPLPDPTPRPTPGGPQTPPVHVYASSDRTEPGGEAVVLIYADDVQEPGIGAWNIDVTYDNSLVHTVNCEAVVGICGPAFSDDTDRMVGADSKGLTGDVIFDRITYRAGNEEGVADIEITINQMTTPGGLDISTPRTIDGSITIKSDAPFGDTDCSGAVDPVDGLAILKSQTSLPPVPQNEPCTDVGDFRLGHRVGDLDCDNDVDSVDALAALRHATSLPPLAQHEPCPDVGSPL